MELQTFFSLNPSKIKALVDASFDSKTSDEVNSRVQPLLDEYGGLEGISDKLRTHIDHGLSTGDREDMRRRREIFGENRLPTPDSKSILQLMWEALHDPTLIILIVCAVISIAIGLKFECPKTGWIEGAAILFAVVVVVLVSAVNDYQKEKQFRALNDINDARNVLVIRDGVDVPSEVSIYDVQAGDVLYLTTGEKICADCYFISGSDMKVSESSLTGESDDVRKGPYAFKSNGSLQSSPFLYSGTEVVAGKARALVIAVGPNSQSGRAAMLLQEAEDEEEDSVLQGKLNAMAELIGKAGLFMAGITLAVLLAKFGYNMGTKALGYEEWNTSLHAKELLGFFVTAVTVLVVAVPEGLPLAVTISLAFSVKKMMNDKNLVRHLSACETMGGATAICSDKTGTLTTNRMTVMRVWSCGRAMEVSQTRSLPESAISLLQKAIVLNCDDQTQIFDKDGSRVQNGNKTECALLGFCLDTGCDYRDARKEFKREVSGKHEFPFSSARKRMSSVCPVSDSKMIACCKGASEIVLGLCDRVLDERGNPTPLSEDAKKRLVETVIEVFAQDGLRTICIAYRELPRDANLEDENNVEKNLVCLGFVGIEDPVRAEVPDAIRKCHDAGITVRMVTGDNITTARSIARKCGILTGEGDEIVMEGPDFRRRVLDSDSKIIQEEMDKIWPFLKVLARSSPTDKHTLVTGLMETTISSQVVAVTGDGTNDAPALRKADVGFAMGISGTEVAKEASDIIIMDDNFSSIVQAVKWGRCVYDNICKFLQFQLTVNLAAIMIAFLGACALGESPLKAIQLLWVNLIMDSFASLALATEGPNEELLKRKPYGRNKPLLSKLMLRFMVGHSIYQLIVLCVLIFYGDNVLHVDLDPSMLPKEGAKQMEDIDPCTHVVPPSAHFTIVFNVFVLMQLFNEINSRKINNELNVFKGFFDNVYFLAILFGTLIVQVILVQFGGQAFGCVGLTISQWLLCLGLGAVVLVLNVILHFVPYEWIPNGEIQEDMSYRERMDSKLREELHAELKRPTSFYRGARRYSRSMSSSKMVSGTFARSSERTGMLASVDS